MTDTDCKESLFTDILLCMNIASEDESSDWYQASETEFVTTLKIATTPPHGHSETLSLRLLINPNTPEVLTLSLDRGEDKENGVLGMLSVPTSSIRDLPTFNINLFNQDIVSKKLRSLVPHTDTTDSWKSLARFIQHAFGQRCDKLVEQLIVNPIYQTC